MNRSMLVVAAVAIAAIVALGAWLLFRGDETETYEVGRGAIDVTIQTIGTVQSTGSTTVRSNIAGEVDIVTVEPGDEVIEGDILVRLDTAPLERAVADAERRLEEAEFALQLAQDEADVNDGDESLRFAVAQAAQRVEDAELSLEDARAALVDAYILAPRPGIVLEVPVRSGDLLNRSAPVAVLYARSDLEIVANVDELDLVNVEIGAEARMRLDAFPDREFTGEVLATAPAAHEQGGATVFPTTITLDVPEDIDIRPGMNADVTIVTEAREDVLLVPQGFIRSVGNRTFVHLHVDGEPVEREVNLGYRSAGQAEVVSGLEEGDVIELP